MIQCLNDSEWFFYELFSVYYEWVFSLNDQVVTLNDIDAIKMIQSLLKWLCLLWMSIVNNSVSIVNYSEFTMIDSEWNLSDSQL